MNDYTVYSSSEYVEALDYALDILEALDFENVIDRVDAKHNINVLRDIKRIYDVVNLP